jgi:pimeloyl-ACP methyl ester carboxylesterase
VLALVLEAPAAIRPQGNVTPTGTPEEIARRIYAHPERMPPVPMRDPLEAARTLLLVRRLRGPNRDAELEARLRDLATQTLVVFGTLDGVIPPDMGRIYKELMPNAHLVFVYDAGHAIAAERPEAFAEVVVDFLERTDAFVISRGRTVVLP